MHRRRTALRLISVVLLFCAAAFLEAQSVDFDALRARDIETAEYYELVSWAEELELSTAGSRSDLQRRIAEHFGIEISTEPREEGRRTVRIEAAEDLQYFELAEIEHDYVRLSGGVLIILSDREDESRHRIEADEVIINQTEEVLSAYGQVRYEIKREGEVERFEGESLTVELESWAGNFLYGTSTRPREIEGEELEFRFTGRAITRSADDTIVIDDGVITSSVADPPNYRITASRIWILDPGDWALQNAVLYVGRVPMFYFPYFFHPGRPHIFHPSFGYRDRDGAYVQTTYYVLGRREDDSQPLSILRLAADDEDIDRVREGFFLRPAEEDERVERTDDTLRLFADIYSNLGAMLAVDGEFNDPPVSDRVDVFAAIAATRLQYGTVGGLDRRTNFYLDEDGVTRQYWSESQFPGLRAPFRFAGDLSTRGGIGPLRLSLDVPLYSDPYFERDLLNRFEGPDWGGLIGLSDERDSPPGVRSTLNWRLNTSFTPSVTPLNPWVTQAQLRTANASIQWRRRAKRDEDLEPHVVAAISPPEESFFYPDTVTLPDLSARVAGTLVDSGRRRPEDDPEDLRDPGRLRPPSFDTDAGDEPPDEDSAPEVGTVSADTLRRPPTRGARPVDPPRDPWSYRLRYTSSPTFSLLARTRDQEWRGPDDVDWQLDYWEENRRLAGSLLYDAAYFDPLVTVDGSLSVSDRYREVFGFSDELDDTEREGLRERAARVNRTTLDSSTGVGIAPLERNEFFEGTRVNYNIDLRLVDRRFDAFVDNEPTYEVTPLAWDEDGVTAHNVGATVAANTLDARQTLGVRFDLPPREERGTADLQLTTGPLRSRVQTGYTRDRETDEVTYDPLSITEILQMSDRARLEQRLTYDINEEHFESSRSDLILGAFRTRFNAARSDRFEFDQDELEWVAQDDVRFRPTSLSAGVDATVEPQPMWRNRIRGDFGLRLDLNSDLQRFTDSSLDVRFTANLDVHQFLDLSLRARSSNEQIYQYVPGLAEQVGRETRNFFVDLLRSFNFFRREDRELSSFNIRELEIDAVHDLGDWDLTVGYRGSPVVTRPNDNNAGPALVEWRSRIEISLDWRPIPEISRSFEIEDGEIDW